MPEFGKELRVRGNEMSSNSPSIENNPTHHRVRAVRWLALFLACAALVSACGSSEEAQSGTERLEDIEEGDIDVGQLGPQEDGDAEDGDSSGGDSTESADDGDDNEEADDGDTPEAEGSGVHVVPTDFDTIQAAVDAASPGDLVLIEPGTYNEAVEVGIENLTIRGLDRNQVILDGELTLDNGFRVAGVDGVAIENLSTVNYTNNGVFFTGVTGYRASYITAQRFGGYGVYAFDAYDGQLDNIYASGAADGGVYVGECNPCNAVVTDVVSEWNGLGYSGTNAGGDLYVVNSTFRFNRAGIVPNSGMYEFCFPQRGTTIAGNLVHDNNNADTAAIAAAVQARGNGILVAGGDANEVMRNTVTDHNTTNIGVILWFDEQSNFDLPAEYVSCDESRELPVLDEPKEVFFVAKDNVVTDNVTSGGGLADIALGVGNTTNGNCFAGNVHESAAPVALETIAACEGDLPTDPDFADGGLDLGALANADQPPSRDYETVELPDPGLQENMADAATAPARPATDVPMAVDLDSIVTPDPA